MKKGYITIQQMFGSKDEIGWRDEDMHPIVYETEKEANKVVEDDWLDVIDQDPDEVKDNKDYIAFANWERTNYRVTDLNNNILFFYFPEDEKYIYP